MTKQINDYNTDKYNQNRFWKMEDIKEIYKIEQPDWSDEKCAEKAKEIFREIKRLNRRNDRCDSLFFKHNTPFSFFDNKDSEFADKAWDGK